MRQIPLIVSLMQPYLFPYLGYLQLIDTSDLFVVRDNVAYSKNGWVNRNRILVNGKPHWLTLPVEHDSHALPINRRNYIFDEKNPLRVLRSVESAYRRAPQFGAVHALLEDILLFGNPNIAAFNTHSLVRIAQFMSIQTPIIVASKFERISGLRGPERVIDICHQLGATTYINPIGGTELYKPECFAEENIDLLFLRSIFREYPQWNPPFSPSLSIIDVLMFNRIDVAREMLKDHELIPHPGLGCSACIR